MLLCYSGPMTSPDMTATHAELVAAYGPVTADVIAKLIGEGFVLIATGRPAFQVPLTIERNAR